MTACVGSTRANSYLYTLYQYHVVESRICLVSCRASSQARADFASAYYTIERGVSSQMVDILVGGRSASRMGQNRALAKHMAPAWRVGLVLSFTTF